MTRPALMDVREAAETLFGSRDHNSYKKLLRLIHANQIPHVALKGRYWVLRNKLEQML
tara:strand:+ start:1727 stop:1900 length:174 start_codon:yes stop_codon:yes gene_type:complete